MLPVLRKLALSSLSAVSVLAGVLPLPNHACTHPSLLPSVTCRRHCTACDSDECAQTSRWHCFTCTWSDAVAVNGCAVSRGGVTQ